MALVDCYTEGWLRVTDYVQLWLTDGRITLLNISCPLTSCTTTGSGSGRRQLAQEQRKGESEPEEGVAGRGGGAGHIRTPHSSSQHSHSQPPVHPASRPVSLGTSVKIEVKIRPRKWFYFYKVEVTESGGNAFQKNDSLVSRLNFSFNKLFFLKAPRVLC